MFFQKQKKYVILLFVNGKISFFLTDKKSALASAFLFLAKRNTNEEKRKKM